MSLLFAKRMVVDASWEKISIFGREEFVRIEYMPIENPRFTTRFLGYPN